MVTKPNHFCGVTDETKTELFGQKSRHYVRYIQGLKLALTNGRSLISVVTGQRGEMTHLQISNVSSSRFSLWFTALCAVIQLHSAIDFQMLGEPFQSQSTIKLIDT